MNSTVVAMNPEFITNVKDRTNYEKFIDFKRLQFIQKQIASITRPGLEILDIGCGNGNISMYLGHSGYNVYGIDISSDAIAIAKKKNDLPNVTFDNLSAEQLVEQNNPKKYDVVICSEVLEHLHDPGVLVKTIHALLAENGILIATVPNGYGPREVFITKPFQWLSKREESSLYKLVDKFKRSLGYDGTTNQSAAADLTHVQFFSKRSFDDLLQNHNFKIKEFEKSDFVSGVFPLSFLTNRSFTLQKIDAGLADVLPSFCTSGFHTSWVKSGKK